MMEKLLGCFQRWRGDPDDDDAIVRDWHAERARRRDVRERLDAYARMGWKMEEVFYSARFFCGYFTEMAVPGVDYDDISYVESMVLASKILLLEKHLEIAAMNAAKTARAIVDDATTSSVEAVSAADVVVATDLVARIVGQSGDVTHVLPRREFSESFSLLVAALAAKAVYEQALPTIRRVHANADASATWLRLHGSADDDNAFRTRAEPELYTRAHDLVAAATLRLLPLFASGLDALCIAAFVLGDGTHPPELERQSDSLDAPTTNIRLVIQNDDSTPAETA